MAEEAGARSAFDTTEIADGESPSGGLRTRLGRLYYHGEPTFLVQTQTYGLRADRGYDGRDFAWWRAEIDRLSSLQQGGVRFRMRIDPWAFCYDPQALAPWVRADGGWDLDRFDETFWSIVRGAAEYAAKKDVLVEVVLFNAGTLRVGRGGTGWARNPFNATLGGPLTRDPAAAFFLLAHPERYDLGAGAADAFVGPEARMQASQERYVRETVGRLEGLDNISWEIASQLEGVDPIRIGFLTHMIELMRRVDTLDRITTASVRSLRRTDQELYREAGIDTVQFWLDDGTEPHEEIVEEVTSLRAFGKPVVVGETDINSDYVTLSRTALWQTYVAGGHPCIGGVSLNDPMLSAFVRFVADTGAAALTFDSPVIASRTDGLHCHAGRTESGTVVLYATTESPAKEVVATLRLPPGAWTATSVEPCTGKTVAVSDIVSTKGTTRLPLPPFDEDMAVRIVSG